MKGESDNKSKSGLIIIAVIVVAAVLIVAKMGLFNGESKEHKSDSVSEGNTVSVNSVEERTLIDSFNLIEPEDQELYDFYELDSMDNTFILHADKIKRIIEAGNADYPYLYVVNETSKGNEEQQYDDVKSTVYALNSEEFTKQLPVTYNKALNQFGSRNRMSDKIRANFNNPVFLIECGKAIIKSMGSIQKISDTSYGDIVPEFPHQGVYLQNPPRSLNGVNAEYDNGIYCKLVEANVPVRSNPLSSLGVKLSHDNINVKSLITDDYSCFGYIGAVVEADVTCERCPDEAKELDWIPEIGETEKITYLVFFSQEFTLKTDAAGVPSIYYIDVVNYQ